MKKCSIVFLILVILLITGLLSSYFIFRNPYKFREDRPIKIFYLNSFHSENFPLTQQNIQAFREVFDNEGIEIVIRQLDMDTVRDPSEENKKAKAKEAMEIIDEWEPDLIYATDDPAQEYVGMNYINTQHLIVFSGVNEDIKKYEYDNAENVAGVLERVHFADAVNHLQEISPGIKKIAVLGSAFLMWDLFMSQMKAQQSEFPDIEFIGWDQIPVYEDFQEQVLKYQNEADALIFLGVDDIVDREGNLVPRIVFIKWLVANSKLPEATFWNFYPKEGTLLSVDISPSEQGKTAGIIAYKILIEGKRPSSFEAKPTINGQGYINLARARQLGLEMPSTILINSKVYENFEWEDE
jgi:ABC-type uncharacterized transport system substrate-binding protein